MISFEEWWADQDYPARHKKAAKAAWDAALTWKTDLVTRIIDGIKEEQDHD